MSKQANTVAVGAFVSGALLILFGVLFYLGGNVFKRNTFEALMVFDGSVKGLKVGAPIAFKGVQIGQVTEFDVMVDTDNYNVMTPVKTRINADRIVRISGGKRVAAPQEQTTDVLIKRGLRAQLQLQSLLTGLLYVELDFHPDSKPRNTAEDLANYDVPSEFVVIPTIPTELEQLSKSLQGLDINALTENLHGALEGINQFTNNPDFQDLPTNVSATLAAVEELSQRLDAEVQALSPDLDRLVTTAGGAMDTLNRDLPGISADTRAALTELTAALEGARNTLANIDYTISDDSAVMFEATQAARELAAAGRALQALAETLDTQPESILKGKSPQGN